MCNKAENLLTTIKNAYEHNDDESPKDLKFNTIKSIICEAKVFDDYVCVNAKIFGKSCCALITPSTDTHK